MPRKITPLCSAVAAAPRRICTLAIPLRTRFAHWHRRGAADQTQTQCRICHPQPTTAVLPPGTGGDSLTGIIIPRQSRRLFGCWPIKGACSQPPQISNPRFRAELVALNRPGLNSRPPARCAALTAYFRSCQASASRQRGWLSTGLEAPEAGGRTAIGRPHHAAQARHPADCLPPLALL